MPLQLSWNFYWTFFFTHNCSIILLCSHTTGEPGWILTLFSGFTICPWTLLVWANQKWCVLGEFPCIHATTLLLYSNLDDHGVHTSLVKVLTPQAQNLSSIWAFRFSNGWHLNFDMVSMVPCEHITKMHEFIYY